MAGTDGGTLCGAVHPVSGQTCAKKPHAPGTQHKARGTAGATWGGRVALGPLGGDARARRGLAKAARAPKVPQCSECFAQETITTVRKATKTREAVTESSLEGGRCRDRKACEERAPALFDVEEITTNAPADH